MGDQEVDLEEDTYVRQSRSTLLFLSKGYFFSANGRKEVGATLANGNPIVLLHVPTGHASQSPSVD